MITTLGPPPLLRPSLPADLQILGIKPLLCIVKPASVRPGYVGRPELLIVENALHFLPRLRASAAAPQARGARFDFPQQWPLGLFDPNTLRERGTLLGPASEASPTFATGSLFNALPLHSRHLTYQAKQIRCAPPCHRVRGGNFFRSPPQGESRRRSPRRRSPYWLRVRISPSRHHTLCAPTRHVRRKPCP